ncbi:hypothetical protein IMZ48_25825 [Candidatus Bathyarchaeota archaeon]|nr:hypothetical protein [Candidatus Bathyarchaeota archaeon]
MSFRYLLSQNHLYREYVETLQAELIEVKGNYAEPPEKLSLNRQGGPLPGSEVLQHPGDAPHQQPAGAAPEPLAAIAQAVMTPPAPMGERGQHDGRDEGDVGQDEMDRSVAMQVDSLP